MNYRTVSFLMDLSDIELVLKVISATVNLFTAEISGNTLYITYSSTYNNDRNSCVSYWCCSIELKDSSRSHAKLPVDNCS